MGALASTLYDLEARADLLAAAQYDESLSYAQRSALAGMIRTWRGPFPTYKALRERLRYLDGVRP